MSPITMALAGILAYRTYHGRGRLAEMMGRAGPAGGSTGTGTAAVGDGGILSSLGGLLGGAGAGSALSGGLADLIKSFQNSGHEKTAQSWVNKGPNQTIAPQELEKAIGSEKIEWLLKETGMSRQELLTELSRELPTAVDQLTPEGRLPTEHEASRLVSVGDVKR